MIILLEGFDGAGKSTLAKKLVKELAGNFKSCHPGQKPENSHQALVYCHEQNGLFKHADKINLVMDRTTCISDDAYTLNRIDQFHESFRQQLESKHIIVVYCWTSGLEHQDFEVSEHDTDDTIQIARDNAYKILKRYDEIVNELTSYGIDVYLYDYHMPEAYENLINHIYGQ